MWNITLHVNFWWFRWNQHSVEIYRWRWHLIFPPVVVRSETAQAWSLYNSNLLGFFNRGAPKRKWKVPTINAQSLSKEAEQKSIKTSCFGCPWVGSTAQSTNFKIILHRIISVVWLTNFLSEIRSLSNHDDETQFRILSVKPIWSFSAFDHWWSLTVQLWPVTDGE